MISKTKYSSPLDGQPVEVVEQYPIVTGVVEEADLDARCDLAVQEIEKEVNDRRGIGWDGLDEEILTDLRAKLKARLCRVFGEVA